MKLLETAERLRIYIGEDDTLGGRPLSLAIVEAARKIGLAGATAYRGVLGFGANSLIHTGSILRLSEDMPVVIEIVDHPEKLDELLPFLDEVVKEGMVTRDPVDVIMYRDSKKKH